MASRHIVWAVLFLGVSIFLMGCGGGGGFQTQTLAQRVQGDWVGTVHDLSRTDAVKCEVTVSGSVVDGKIEASDGTILGTVHGTIGDDDAIDVDYEYDGEEQGDNGTIEPGDENDQSENGEQAEGENDTIEVDEDNEQIDMHVVTSLGGQAAHSIEITLARK